MDSDEPSNLKEGFFIHQKGLGFRKFRIRVRV